MNAERLRVAILLPERVQPAWVRRVLSDVATSEVATLALVVNDATPRSKRRMRLPGAAFRAYETLDRRVFDFHDDHAALDDASPLLEGVASLEVQPVRSHAATTLAAADVEAIRAHRPDLLLSLGFAPLTGDVLDVASLGLWSFDHLRGDGAPAFAREVLRGEPSLELCLRATTSGGSRVLQRSFAMTDRNSLHRSRNAAIWKSASFVARALRSVAAGRDGADQTLPSQPFAESAPIPSALDVARFGAGIVRRVGRDRLRRRRADFLWFVALRPSRGSLVDGALDGFRPLPMPPGRFWADPMLVADGDRTWLFVEDAGVASQIGLLRCSEVLADGSLGESRVVLDCDYHLSYPFVFRNGGHWYMLPETSEHRTVELWRATEFPWRWELDKILMHDVVAVDATLLERDGRLWLFMNLHETGAAHEDLFLFHADSLHDEWQPHPLNPIVSDLRRARPAGPLFVESGALYRPAQDCSADYGSAIWLHRIDVLDAHEYRETPVRRIDSSWHPGATSTHTIVRAGGFDALDAKMWVRRGATIA